jgi:hypothetical protein
MNILGLDISTSITGATVLDKDENILYCEAWDTRNKKHFPTLLHKADFLKAKLLEVKRKFDISNIYIEESLQSFRSGFSSAKTLSILSKINGIVSYLAFDIFSTSPVHLSAISARKACDIKVLRGQKAKMVVLENMLDKHDRFVISYTRSGNPSPGSFDRADSLVIAIAGLKSWKEKN